MIRYMVVVLARPRGRRPGVELEIHRAQLPCHIARTGVGQGANGGVPVRLAHDQDRRRAILEDRPDPNTIVAPFTPGTPADVAARRVAQAMTGTRGSGLQTNAAPVVEIPAAHADSRGIYGPLRFMSILQPRHSRWSQTGSLG